MPPHKRITFDFLKNVLKGDKVLLLTKEIRILPNIFRHPGIHMPTFWEDLKSDTALSKYFPDSFINKKRIPDRTFVLIVR